MPRRKIVSSVKSDLPKLTEKQKQFCAHILAGKSQREAYKLAYDVVLSTDAMVDCDASRLRNSPKIALWLDAVAFEHIGCSLQDHLVELNRLKRIAIRTGNIGAAVQAEQLRGKASGHYVEQFADVTPNDPARALQRIAEIDPELARKLAKRDGIAWPPAETATKH